MMVNINMTKSMDLVSTTGLMDGSMKAGGTKVSSMDLEYTQTKLDKSLFTGYGKQANEFTLLMTHKLTKFSNNS